MVRAKQMEVSSGGDEIITLASSSTTSITSNNNQPPPARLSRRSMGDTPKATKPKTPKSTPKNLITTTKTPTVAANGKRRSTPGRTTLVDEQEQDEGSEADLDSDDESDSDEETLSDLKLEYPKLQANLNSNTFQTSLPVCEECEMSGSALVTCQGTWKWTKLKFKQHKKDLKTPYLFSQ